MAGGFIDWVLRLTNRASGPLEDAATSAREAEERARRLDEQLDRLGAASGRVGQGAQKLRGALGLLSPELAGLAGLVDDGADAMEVFGGAGGRMLPVLGSLAVAVGAAAAAYQMLASDLRAAEAAQVRAATVASEAQDYYRDLAVIERQVAVESGAMSAAAAAEAAAREAVSGRVAAHTQALQAQRAALEEERQGLIQTTVDYYGLGDAIDRVAELNQQLLGPVALVANAWSGYRERVRSAAAESEVLATRLAQGAAAGAKAADAAGELAARMERERQASASSADSARLAAERSRLLAEAVAILDGELDQVTRTLVQAERQHAALADRARELRQPVDQVAAALAVLEARAASARRALDLSQVAVAFEAELRPVVDAAAESLGEFYAALDEIVPPTALSQVEQLALLAQDLDAAFAAGRISAEQYTAALEAMGGAKARAQDDATPSPSSSQSRSAGVLGTVASGPQAALSAAGGGTAGAVSELLTAIGEGLADRALDWADSVLSGLERLDDFLVTLISGAATRTLLRLLASIPELVDGILLDALPAVMQTLVNPGFWVDVAGAFLAAVVQTLGSVVEFLVRLVGEAWREAGRAIIQGIRSLFSAETWLRIGRSIAEAVREALRIFRKDRDGDGKRGLREAADTVGDWFRSGFDTGTDYVTKTGVRMVHEGERIIPATGAASQRTLSMLAGRGAGGATHVHLPQGLIIGTPDQVVRELNRHLGTQARGLAWAT